ncbi:hypothetical protein M885DRAFT_433905 [Pelagophyceae sp. CCMP2097]|nr:hypothetical protein M885DRAFT_433905 [Pelagophyceae sp. CCMP2097]
MDPAALERYVVDVLLQPKYRAKQLRTEIFDKGVVDFSAMQTLPKKFRDELLEKCSIGGVIASVAVEQVSTRDGTIKRAYTMLDGTVIESVLMLYNDGRRTACISSQVGCAMRCAFCATGQMGFTRNLSSAEIFEQAARFSRELTAKGERLSNVVYMGMGEPMANYDAVLESVRRINTELGIGARSITISTVGLVNGIDRLAEEPMQVGLAVSLHHSTDAARSAIMPINKRYDLAALLGSVRKYQLKTNRKVTFEWAAISGVNDGADTAKELAQLLQQHEIFNAHVNVIPLNPTAGYGGARSRSSNVDEFCALLVKKGYSATPRVRRGIDIDAGCGQLTTKLNEAKKVAGGEPTPSMAALSDSIEDEAFANETR